MNKDIERNLKRFRRWLCENAVARVINGFLPTFLDDKSKKIKVIVNDSMQPCTDGNTIYVSLISQLLEDDYTPEEWLLALKAATAHEAQHINSSNFKDIEEIREWYGKYLADHYQLDPTIGKSIAQNALNIVEDGRIERIAALRRPGMYYPFRFLNDILRESTAISSIGDTPADEYRDFWGTVLSYSKTGLYSPGVEVYAHTRMEANMLGVQSLIDDAVASNSSSECRNLVQELLEDAAPYIVDLIKSDPDLEDSLKEHSPKDEYTSNKGEAEQGSASSGASPLRAPATPKQGNSGESKGEDSKAEESNSGNAGGSGEDSKSSDEKGNESSGGNSESSSKEDSGDPDGDSKSPNKGDDSGSPNSSSSSAGKKGSESSDDSADKSQQDSATGFNDSSKRLDPLSESAMEDIKKQMEKELSSANREEKSSQNSVSNEGPSQKDIEDIRASYSGTPLPINYTTVFIAGTDELPADLKLQALSLRREITRIQEARSRASKGLRRGTLDTGALWKTGLREETIFSRKGNPNAGSIVFYIALDNSGSMAASSGSGIKKYQAARSAAAVIEEASKGIIPCKIALFDQGCSKVNHSVIKSFDETKGANRAWNSLTAIGPGGGNMDSVNIRISAKELQKRPEKKKVLLLLSDGTPSAYGSRSEALAEVRQSVLDSRRKGIIVIPIMFGDADFFKSTQKSYELMYEKNIIACEPKEITNRLCALFRQIVSR